VNGIKNDVLKIKLNEVKENYLEKGDWNMNSYNQLLEVRPISDGSSEGFFSLSTADYQAASSCLDRLRQLISFSLCQVVAVNVKKVK